MAYADEVLADVPLAYWRLGEPSGVTTMVDSSGNGRDGTYYSNVVQGAPGLLGDDPDLACDFTANSICFLPFADWMNTGVVSVEAWVCPTVAFSNRTIASRYEPNGGSMAWTLRIDDDRFIMFNLAGGFTWTYSTTTVVPGAVYHVVGVLDGTDVKLYVNGVLESTAASTALASNNAGFRIGSGGDGEYFYGRIDEVAVYDTALSADRITAHYALGAPPSDPPPVPPTIYTQEDPLVLTGTSGTFDIDFTADVAPQWINYTPTDGGSLAVSVDTPSGWLPAFTVLDDDGDPMLTETDGSLDVIWSADSRMQISIEPGLTEPTPGTSVTCTWTYAARASSPLVVVAALPEIIETPGALPVEISNGAPLDPVTFTLPGFPDFQTITLDEAGNAIDVAVMLPSLDAGTYTLVVEGVTSGSTQVDFNVLEDGLSYANQTPKPAPTPPVTVPTLHWRFFDVRDPDVLNYEMPRNPRSWTNVHPPNDFTHDKTTAVDGQTLTWQAAPRPWRMEFTGYLDTQDEYEHLAFWCNLRRRFWLVDHRNRAWLVTFEHFDAVPRIVPSVPWAHNYTVKAVIFMQGSMG